jgi:hypothetical protein
MRLQRELAVMTEVRRLSVLGLRLRYDLVASAAISV